MSLSIVITLAVALTAVLIGVMLAYLPMRLALNAMSRRITGTVREFVQRQRDRRRAKRDTPDRRGVV
jgi:hypothetical protein